MVYSTCDSKLNGIGQIKHKRELKRHWTTVHLFKINVMHRLQFWLNSAIELNSAFHRLCASCAIIGEDLITSGHYAEIMKSICQQNYSSWMQEYKSC